jgi:hypothetical protein
MNLFNFNKSKKIKELEDEVDFLKSKLDQCASKLVEKQEHINKTNAFWKKKVFEIKQKKGL